MTTRTSLFVTLLTSLSGCVLQTGGGDDEADTSTEFSELDEVAAAHATEHNHPPNHVPVFNHAGVTTTVARAARSTSTTSSSRTWAATAGAA
jgi:hypothetical protein